MPLTSSPDWTAAMAAWQQAIGAEHVVIGDAIPPEILANVSGLERRVPAVLRPANADEVQAVVRVANQFKTPLHPVSTGFNWGLGSALPVHDDVAMVHLGRMNRIHRVDVEQHYAVIEPGVTQGQLYDHITENGWPLRINVTGSGRNTSLIGNTLERGIGYFSSRADSLTGLEVVLGSGERIRTGFGHLDGCRITHLYRHGIGPDLSGLFFQSNVGIVTRAGFDLIPASANAMSVVVKIQEEADFVPFFDALVALRRRGIMRTIWHVGNRNRSEIALAPLVYDVLRKRHPEADATVLRRQAVEMLQQEGFGAWNAVGGVFGSPALLRVVRKEISQALRGIGRVEFLTDRKLASAKWMLDRLSFSSAWRRKRVLLEAIEPLYGLSKGIPTDAALKSVLWPVGEGTESDVSNPDTSHSGMLYALPFIPLDGAVAREVVDLAIQIFERAGFKAYITLNFVDTKVAEAVINLAFDRRDTAQTDAAHRCIDQLTSECIRRGYPPYRVGIQSMSHIIDETNPYWKTVQNIKASLDPNQILSPGRYSSPQ